MVAVKKDSGLRAKVDRQRRRARSSDLDISRVTSKGQITITSRIRKGLGLKPGDEVLMTVMPDKTVKLRRLPTWEEFMNSLPLAKVPPIDWKAARQEMAEEIAEEISRQIADANERHRRADAVR